MSMVRECKSTSRKPLNITSLGGPRFSDALSNLGCSTNTELVCHRTCRKPQALYDGRGKGQLPSSAVLGRRLPDGQRGSER